VQKQNVIIAQNRSDGGDSKAHPYCHRSSMWNFLPQQSAVSSCVLTQGEAIPGGIQLDEKEKKKKLKKNTKKVRRKRQ